MTRLGQSQPVTLPPPLSWAEKAYEWWRSREAAIETDLRFRRLEAKTNLALLIGGLLLLESLERPRRPARRRRRLR